MPKTREQKKEILKNLEDKITRAKSIVFASFNGLEAEENNRLRQKLKSEQSEYFVAKKTLFNLALKDKKISGLDVKKFEGKIAAIFGYEDEVAPAKTIYDFKKKNENKIDFVGGILENRFLSEEKVTALAKLPNKTELYAKMIGSLNAPISGFVNALAGNLKNMVYVLNAIKEKKSN